MCSRHSASAQIAVSSSSTALPDFSAAAGNSTLSATLAFVSKTPMAGAGAISLNGALPLLEYRFIQRTQSDHEDVLTALNAGEGARPEALMREHAYRSRDNKRALMPGAQKNQTAKNQQKNLIRPADIASKQIKKVFSPIDKGEFSYFFDSTNNANDSAISFSGL